MTLRILNHLEEWLISALMAAATVLIFASVVLRYATGVHVLYPYVSWIDLSWAQELCIYMFIWMAKFGAAYGVRSGIHVGVDVLVNRLADTWKRRVTLLSLLAGALFTGIIAVLGAVFVWRIRATGQVSPDLELPMWLVYLAIPLGSGLMCFRFLQVAVTFLRTGEVPHHEHAQVQGLDDVTLADVSRGPAP